VKQAVAILVVLAMGCGSAVPVIQYSGLPEKQHIEKRDLPDPPDKEAIPVDRDWVKPLPAGAVHDQHGILISPEKAARAKQWQLGYRNLRDLYEVDRAIWSEQRVIYDERLRQANKDIEKLSPSWWSSNKGTVGMTLGFVVGVAATVGIVYGVDEAKQ